MFTKNKCHIIITLSLMLLFTTGLLHSTSVYAESVEKTVILEFDTRENCTITNAEGETLVHRKYGELSGNMGVISEKRYMGIFNMSVVVKWSSSFTYKAEDAQIRWFGVQGRDISGYVRGYNIEKVTISVDENLEKRFSLDGKDLAYQIDYFSPNNDETGITIEGNASSHVEVIDGKDGIVIDGAEGICHLTVDSLTDRPIVRKYDIFPTKDSVVISNVTNTNAPIQISGAIVLGRKSHDVVSNLRLRNTDDDTALLLTFSKVKKADGYDVYRYNEKSKKYVKVKTLKGNGNIAWLDKGLVSGQQYKYKVQPWRTVSKKKKAMKMSYHVWAITASETKANVTKIVVGQAKVTGKKGQAAKLTATATTVEGKEVFSGDVRWHSSDRAIATVDKNGKVKLLKKGVCTIWAKTHNGLNSRKVMIRVK
jgi:hypothetical protein